MIVDANVIVSASLGRSLPLVRSVAVRHAALLVPEHQMREARLVTAARAGNDGLDADAVFGWTGDVLLPIPRGLYEGYEEEARARLRPGGQRDWPLVALSLASGYDVWSNDHDLFGTGIVVWNTHNIMRAKGGAHTGAEHG